MCWSAKVDMELLAEFTASRRPAINMEPLTGFRIQNVQTLDGRHLRLPLQIIK